MNFTPVNSYLSVRSVEDTEDDNSSILLPQDYRAVDSPFAVVEVVNCSGESGTLWGTGLQLVVEAHMLRDIQGSKIYLTNPGIQDARKSYMALPDGDPQEEEAREALVAAIEQAVGGEKDLFAQVVAQMEEEERYAR